MNEPTERRAPSRSLVDTVEEVFDTFWEIGSSLLAAGMGALALAQRLVHLIGGAPAEPARGVTPRPGSSPVGDDAAPPVPRIHLEAHQRLSSAVALETAAIAEPFAAPERVAPADQAPLAGEGGPLPSSYGADRLTVMPKDPGTVFAFWDVRPETHRRVRARLERLVAGLDRDAARVALRITPVDVQRKPGEAVEGKAVKIVSLPPLAVSWYVDVEGDARRIEVAIGLAAGDVFLELAAPVAVSLPPRSVSPDEAVRWRTRSGEDPPQEMAPERPPREVSDGILRSVGSRAGSSGEQAPGPHLLELDFGGSHSAARR
jgi:hypothetical protein